MTFSDRVAAGRRLATELTHLRGRDVVVLGLPRGGVPVAFEVARVLDAPLDVIVVRKVGVPWQPELAMGAVGEDGVTIVNDAVVRMAAVSDNEFAVAATAARAELGRRVSLLRGACTRTELTGRTAVIVDDGIATGATARAACQVARAHGASEVVLAVPVASPGAVEAMSAVADEVVCVRRPPEFFAVGEFYDDFTATTDREVVNLLDRAAATRPAGRQPPVVADDPPAAAERARVSAAEVTMSVGGVTLAGRLTMPTAAAEVVVFAYGSARSRYGPRNRAVARVLHQEGLGTLLADLLTPDEEADRDKVFDVDLLADRLSDVVGWLRRRPDTAGLPGGLHGTGTGSAAALRVCADPTVDVTAVVCRSGRPDLVGPRLDQVRTPALFIVGGLDGTGARLARAAQQRLRSPSEVVIVPGATHLFDEPGTLRAAAQHAADWFRAYLPTRERSPVGRGARASGRPPPGAPGR